MITFMRSGMIGREGRMARGKEERNQNRNIKVRLVRGVGVEV